LSKDDNADGKIDENHHQNKEYLSLKKRVDQLQATANNLTTQVTQLKNENINYIDLINGSVIVTIDHYIQRIQAMHGQVESGECARNRSHK
jgi:transcription initiation factor IIF auxiliary subunit